VIGTLKKGKEALGCARSAQQGFVDLMLSTEDVMVVLTAMSRPTSTDLQGGRCQITCPRPPGAFHQEPRAEFREQRSWGISAGVDGYPYFGTP
jgi:hypothetical protein